LIKAKKLNEVMTDSSLTIAEKQSFVDTLSESEMRGIFKEMMTVWDSKKIGAEENE
jgi:hypothetical protein